MALAAFLVLPGCEEIERTGLKPPCGVQGVARVELGRPSKANQTYAKFSTKGGQLYLTAYDFGKGGLGDRDVEFSKVFIGSGGAPKVDGDEDRPLNTTITTDVIEDDFTAVELPPGDYWLTAGAANIEVVSCEKNGVTDEKPVLGDFPPRQRINLKPPCGDQGVSRVDLGSPSFDTLRRYEDPTTYAEFAAKGGPLYVIATGFKQGSDDQPILNQTSVLIGHRSPKRGIETSNRVTNYSYWVDLVENDFHELEVSAGRYWLLTSKEANIAVISCQADGVSDPKPVSAAPSPPLDSERQRRSAP
ncbi:MAG: hypothetical protein WD627_11700 [Actinomycetota bacterium]